MRIYYASLIQDKIKIYCQDSENSNNRFEIKEKEIRDKAIEFALSVETNADGNRVLKEGQSRVIDSMYNAFLFKQKEEEQYKWEKAAKKTITNKEENNIISIVPNDNNVINFMNKKKR